MVSGHGMIPSLADVSSFLVTLNQVTSDVLNPVTRMAWARLIGNKEMVEMIAWELGS
jgi:hypothetical protein